MPRINTNDNDVEIIDWLIEEGAQITKGADLVEVTTSKAAMILEAPVSGFVEKLAKKGDVVAVGKPICKITSKMTTSLTIEKSQNEIGYLPTDEVSKFQTISKVEHNFLRLSKKAKTIVANDKINEESLSGLGLVSKKVLENQLKLRAKTEPLSAEPIVKTNITDASTTDQFANLRFENIDRNKKFEIKALTAGQSGNINSSLTVVFESAKVREALKKTKAFNSQILPIIIYELAQAIKGSPKFNSFYENEKIYFYQNINVGIAIDLGLGLKVAVIKNANQLMPIEIFKYLTEYSLKYLKAELTIEDISDGTITVTDLSGQNILHFQPLINQRQTVIFGIGGDIEMPNHPMSITCVFDHRVLAGRDVGDFLSKLKKNILYISSNLTVFYGCSITHMLS
jgi:2-oxoglutarate dehydrogenase E2 component (dihydrolipoamide succinyltransferase)